MATLKYTSSQYAHTEQILDYFLLLSYFHELHKSYKVSSRSFITLSMLLEVLKRLYQFLTPQKIAIPKIITCNIFDIPKFSYIYCHFGSIRGQGTTELTKQLDSDDQISASSTFGDNPMFQPHFARLGSPYRRCSIANETASKDYQQVCHIILLLLSTGQFSMWVENQRVELIVKIEIFNVQLFLKLGIDCHLIVCQLAGWSQFQIRTCYHFIRINH